MNEVLTEIQQDFRNVDIQKKSLGKILQLLKNEKDPLVYERVFKIVKKSIENNIKVNVVLDSAYMIFSHFFMQKINFSGIDQGLLRLIIETFFLCFRNREDLCIMFVTQLIALKGIKLGEIISFSKIVDSFTQVIQFSTKSSKTVVTYLQFVEFLLPKGSIEYLALCEALLILSKQIPINDGIQDQLIVAFDRITNNEIMKSLYISAIPLFIEVLYKRKAYRVFKPCLSIANKSPITEANQDIIRISSSFVKELNSDHQTLGLALDFAINKCQSALESSSLIQLGISGMISSFYNPKIVENSLTALFKGIKSSGNGDTFPQIITFIAINAMIYYQSSKTIIRRGAAVIHSLSLFETQKSSLLFSGAGKVIVDSLSYYSRDQTTSKLLINSLSSILNNAKYVRSVNNESLIGIIRDNIENAKDITILTGCLSIMKYLVLSKHSIEEFFLLKKEKKGSYEMTIPSKFISNIIESKDKDMLKSLMMLSSNNDEIITYLNDIVSRYVDDFEIVILCLSFGQVNMSVLSRIIQIHKDRCYPYVRSFLRVESLLPQAIISYLLSISTSESNTILIDQIKHGNGQLILGQIKTFTPDMINLMGSLFLSGVWKPSEDQFPKLIEALYRSSFDEIKVYNSLNFVELYGLTDSSFPYLLYILRQYNSKSNIVCKCCLLLSTYSHNKFCEDECIFYNAVATSIKTLYANINECNACDSVLRFILYLSRYDSLRHLYFKTNLAFLLKKVSLLYLEMIKLILQICSSLSDNRFFCQQIVRMGLHDYIFSFFGEESYSLILHLIENGFYCLDFEQLQIIFDELGHRYTTLKEEQIIELLLIICLCLENGTDFSLKDYKPTLVSLLSIYSKNFKIVSIIIRILYHFVSFYDYEDLLFTLIELMRSNISSIEFVEIISHLFGSIPQNERNIIVLSSPSTISVFIDVIKHYYQVPMKIICLFPFVHRQTEVFEVSIKSMKILDNLSDQIAISSYLLTINYPLDRVFLGELFSIIERSIDSFELCSNLFPLLFYSTEIPENQSLVYKNLSLMTNIVKKHICSNRVSRAYVAVIYLLLSNENINQKLFPFIESVIMIYKAWPLDDQIVQFFSEIVIMISNKNVFVPAFPIIGYSLRNQTEIQYLIEAIICISSVLGYYAQEYTDILISTYDDVSEENQISILNCLTALSSQPYVEDTICKRLDFIFEMIITEPEESKIRLLNICSLVKTSNNISEFEQHIPYLIKILGSQKSTLATACGQCILSIAQKDKSLIEPFIEDISQVAESASGDLMRICISIKSALFDYNRYRSQPL